MNSPVLQRFFSGDYADLVKTQVDQGKLDNFGDLEQAYLIGALVFVGRRLDAKAEFKKHKKSASVDAKTVARFFLGVGACRDSEYAEAKKLFLENYSCLNKIQTAEARFYVYQGLGFFRFFCSRYGKAILWSEKAWQIAFASRFQYGMTLSADMRGHSLIQVGKIAQGLSFLESTLKGYPEKSGVRTAMEISLICYRAQFGLLEHASQALLKKWKNLDSSDTYSRSNLTLERARALLLEGNTDKALEWLEKGAQEIFRFGHRRQKAIFLARRAHALLLQGRKAEAKIELRDGLALLDPEADLSHRLELLGLSSRLESNEDSERLIADLTLRTGRVVSKQILARGQNISLPASDDPLGQALEHLAREPGNAEFLLQVQKKGWNGLFRQLVEQEPGLVFYFDLLPGSLVVFQKGNVHISPSGVPSMLQRLLITLAQGPATKEQLVETVWGYKYNSLRHDPMLYNGIYRLRQLLGSFEKLLIATPEGYTWREPVKARVFERDHPVKEKAGAQSDFLESRLTLRQLRALELCKAEQGISVSRYAKAFKVAKATATRDLAELVKKGYLTRMGLARATAYLPRGTI